MDRNELRIKLIELCLSDRAYFLEHTNENAKHRNELIREILDECKPLPAPPDDSATYPQTIGTQESEE